MAVQRLVPLQRNSKWVVMMSTLLLVLTVFLRKKRFGRKGVHPSHSTIPIEDGDPEAEHKMCITYASDANSASDDDTPVNLHVVVDWELLPTGLGWVNVIYRKDNSRKLEDLSRAGPTGSTCQDMCDEFSKIMHDEFKMSMMGELNFFLGLQIKQMEDGIFFNQCKYIKEMLKKFGLEESKPMKTPMSSDTKLTKDEECESVDSTKYRGMIVSLLYLTASRPNIMFSVCLCARFQEAPKTSHLEAVKRIIQYIKVTTHLRL
ncbi:retrovirus-related pol polyprotein from transposon TNT 1-94 [Tanacetum coccineum]